MHVIGLNVHGMKFPSLLGSNSSEYSSEGPAHLPLQEKAAMFWNPDYVIVDVIGCVPCLL